MLKRSCFFILVLLCCRNGFAQQIFTAQKNAVNIAAGNIAIYVDEKDDTLVTIAATLLQQDMEKVTGIKPDIIHRVIVPHQTVIIAGIAGRSSLLKQLVQAKKINVAAITNKWEAYQIQTLQNPFAEIDNAIVVAGSDRRGAAYGLLELSKQLGISPWYWWADVPVAKKEALFINKNITLIDSPRVKYRGIFINDEAPAFAGWAKEKFGGFNHHVYVKVFELLLRLKANYLWPAMWGNAFNTDDTLNPVLADKYGIVMGTSHHEPMLRAQQEWKQAGKGEWNYQTNDTVLRAFWQQGIANMGNHESIVTIGMRGDGDMPMTEGTATSLLEKIVADQRIIIQNITGKPADQTPQLWALYKEVQDYYDKGMRVPDDVTLLLCDDNWGNIRKLPRPGDKPRKGGYGIYYHFDYVGDPRNYKWLNTNNIARVWEQMHLAYEHNARQVWIVNVGDIKPMEYPISFFLDYAWNPDKITASNLDRYPQQWATAQFGKKYAADIADILNKYTQYNARRKPELLSPETYSLTTLNEADYVVKDYNALLAKAEKINAQLPDEYKAAFFELVLHPVKACANLNELYVTAAKNQEAYQKQWAIANTYADKAKQLYANDSLLSRQYHQLLNGKWNHMMDQTHIGYTNWQQPAVQTMPRVNYVAADAVIEQEPAIDTTVQSGRFLVPKNSNGNIFYESDNWAGIPAAAYTRAIGAPAIQWQVIKNIGRDGDGITPFPVTAPTQKLLANSPHLEYDVYAYTTGKVALSLYFSPTLNFNNTATGLQYAISIDGEQPQVFSLNKEGDDAATWRQWVADNIIVKTSAHTLLKAGRHTIKYWMIDAGIVLQKMALDLGGLKPSYLGPPDTKIN